MSKCDKITYNVFYLNKFIEVYGNRHKHLHLIAMRFKQPIIYYNTFKPALESVLIDLPKNSIVVIRGILPPIKPYNVGKQILLFTVNSRREGSIPVTNGYEDTLLRTLFKPRNKILFSIFKSGVLFLIATANPFSRIMTKCRKDRVFRAFYYFMEARYQNRPLTLEEVSQLRFFMRYEGELKQFNKWSPFAFILCSDSCYLTTCSNPSTHLGNEIFLMLKRSTLPPVGPLPPPEFYQCEILLSDTEPVGVAFAISRTNYLELDYVSPMVVANPPCAFRDISSIQCDDWLMLYQNHTMWQKHGLKFYALDFYKKKLKLKLVLSWLQLQTSEKYKLLYMDLVQVAKILFGENPNVNENQLNLAGLY